jgi:hypothetical protein
MHNYEEYILEIYKYYKKIVNIELKIEDLVFLKTLFAKRFDIRRYHFQ